MRVAAAHFHNPVVAILIRQRADLGRCLLNESRVAEFVDELHEDHPNR
jgi:hypothetical protein